MSEFPGSLLLVTLDDLLTSEVRDFCVQQGILGYAQRAIDLAQKYFPSIQALDLRQLDDVEAGEEWLITTPLNAYRAR